MLLPSRLAEHIIVYKNSKNAGKNTKAKTAIGKHRNKMLIQWIRIPSVQETCFSQFNGYYFTGDGCKRDKEGLFWLVMVHPETGRVKEKSSLKMDWFEKNGTRNSGVLKFETQNWWLKMYSTPPNTTQTWINIGSFNTRYGFSDPGYCSLRQPNLSGH